MSDSEELSELARNLDTVVALSKRVEVAAPLNALQDAAIQVGKSFSGSWLGYHSRVYYEGFALPPAGAHFDAMGVSFDGSRGNWVEYKEDAVKAYILQLASNPNLDKAQELANKAKEIFEAGKQQFLSIVFSHDQQQVDTFLVDLKQRASSMKVFSAHNLAAAVGPSGPLSSADIPAISQGVRIPPHIGTGARVTAIEQTFSLCEKLSGIVKSAASHIERKSRQQRAKARVGTNIFIGHGRSREWRDLKDFINERLRLPWDEFNRVPVAGVTNIARLSEMLDAAAIAFLVMTAEDEMLDGKVQARMNVVHEAGLFQGRLGFSRAIVLLEDGCEEFSNIQGLGQIRFPKGNIKAAFEEIRRVLEREEIIAESTS